MATSTLLIGLGKGGSALMPYLLANPEFDLVGVCDSSGEAVGRPMAQRCRLPVYEDPITAMRELRPILVIDATGDPSLPSTLYEVRPAGSCVVTGEASRLLWQLLSAVEGQRRAELRFNRLLADMRSGMLVIQDAKIRYVNQAFCENFGYTMEETLGHNYAEILTDSTRERDLDLHQKRIAGKPALEEYETQIRHREGAVKDALVRARRSEWDGRPASLLIMNDVTQLRELQRERERFFRFMVHELRAPLSPIVTAVSLLREPKVREDAKRMENLLALLKRSTDRLQRFVDDFLHLSKFDKEELTILQEEVDLKSVVMDVVDNQRLLAEDKGLELKVLAGEDIPIRGDRFAISTVLQNLVNNAIKYTDKGCVAVSVSRDGANFSVRVADTGIGLSPDEQKNLFQEFGRIQRLPGVKGSGLGLALVEKLVSACGGKVSVESKGRNQGTAFTFTLPLVFGDPNKK